MSDLSFVAVGVALIAIVVSCFWAGVQFGVGL